MDDDKIFRKVAMERLNSPENLDQVMRVVPAKGWIALVCLFVFAAVVFAWAFLGEIAQQVEAQGVFTRLSDTTAGEVVAVLSAESSRSMQAGDAAIVSLSSGETLSGTVVSITNADGATQSKAIIRLNLGEAAKAATLLAGAGEQTFQGAMGWPCTVRITTHTIHPIQMILPD